MCARIKINKRERSLCSGVLREVPGLVLETLTLLALPRWGDAARRGGARLLRLEIGVDKDELVRWCRPEQWGALSCLAHLAHPQFEQRSRSTQRREVVRVGRNT